MHGHFLFAAVTLRRRACIAPEGVLRVYFTQHACLHDEEVARKVSCATQFHVISHRGSALAPKRNLSVLLL